MEHNVATFPRNLQHVRASRMTRSRNLQIHLEVPKSPFLGVRMGWSNFEEKVLYNNQETTLDRLSPQALKKNVLQNARPY